MECDRRASPSKGPLTCRKPSSSTPSAPRSAVPSRARSHRCARTRPLAFVIDQLLERNPGVDPATVEELVAGCGLPQGLQANNIARIAVLLSDKLGQETNGSTDLALLRVRPRRDPHRGQRRAGGPGRRLHRRRRRVRLALQRGAGGRAPARTRTRTSRATTGQPNAYIAMGLTAENVAERYGVSREDQDRYAQRSQERAVAAQESGVFDREIVPVTLADGTVVSKDDGPRAELDATRSSARWSPPSSEDGTVTAGNSCPLNDGAAAALIMSADKAKELGLKPRARIITAATCGQRARVHGRRADRGGQEGPGPRRHDDRRRRRLRAQRGVRGAGAADRRRRSASTWTSSTRTAARSRSATRSG